MFSWMIQEWEANRILTIGSICPWSLTVKPKHQRRKQTNKSIWSIQSTGSKSQSKISTEPKHFTERFSEQRSRKCHIRISNTVFCRATCKMAWVEQLFRVTDLNLP